VPLYILLQLSAQCFNVTVTQNTAKDTFHIGLRSSIVSRVDTGLPLCTHYVILLTNTYYTTSKQYNCSRFQ